MKVAIVYRDFTEYSREVTDWLHDFKKITGYELETIDPDSIGGEIFCKAHDVVEYPTIVALTGSGQVLQMWEGRPLPAFNEVSYYASNVE